MNSFTLCRDGGSSHTSVPNLFLDRYMPQADGEYVKIYLFLLRCLEDDGRELSIPLIAERFERTESYVRRALEYWERMKLLKLEYNSSQKLTGVCMLNEEAGEYGSKKASRPAFPDSEDLEASQSPSTGRRAAKSRETAPEGAVPAPLSPAEAKQLLFICEQYLGKPLSSREVSDILDFHDTLGFSAELIEYLVEYCVSGGHKSLRYIKATARGWHEKGCTTVAQAKEETAYSRSYYKIMKAFGLSGRQPAQVEITWMERWLRDYGFSTELIAEACSRTIAAIHQPSFEYADKILSGWKEKQVAELSDLEALDRSRQAEKESKKETASRRSTATNRFHNFKERDYDFRELEKRLINQ